MKLTFKLPKKRLLTQFERSTQMGDSYNYKGLGNIKISPDGKILYLTLDEGTTKDPTTAPQLQSSIYQLDLSNPNQLTKVIQDSSLEKPNIY